MQHISGPDWYAQELAQLEDEMARLYRLLEGITPIGEPHEDTPRPRDGAPQRLSASHGRPPHSRRVLLRVLNRAGEACVWFLHPVVLLGQFLLARPWSAATARFVRQPR